MAGSGFGKNFRITTWGESHGAGLGVVVDGCPAGLSLCEADVQAYLDRRKPGASAYSTPRKEADRVRILSPESAAEGMRAHIASIARLYGLTPTADGTEGPSSPPRWRPG